MIVPSRGGKITPRTSMSVMNLVQAKLENVHCYNNLGVMVDDKLYFSEFAQNKYNKVNVRLYHRQCYCKQHLQTNNTTFDGLCRFYDR